MFIEACEARMRMDLVTSWIIASKDLKVFRRKKRVFYGTIIFPLILLILFPAIIEFAERNEEEFLLQCCRGY